jgi:hypothetical protein
MVLNQTQTRVPHLRDSFIVAKVGIREANRAPQLPLPTRNATLSTDADRRSRPLLEEVIEQGVADSMRAFRPLLGGSDMLAYLAMTEN